MNATNPSIVFTPGGIANQTSVAIANDILAVPHSGPGGALNMTTITFLTNSSNAVLAPTATWAITNKTFQGAPGGPYPLTNIVFSLPTVANLTGATISAVGATPAGFTAFLDPLGQYVRFTSSFPSGIQKDATATFGFTFALPSGAGGGGGFDLVMTANPEPTSMCLMGLGMAVAGGGSFWRKRRNKGVTAPTENPPIV